MNGSSSSFSVASRVLERFSWFEVESDVQDTEVDVLLKRLDPKWQAQLEASGQRKQDLIEIFLQLGRRPKAIFDNSVSKETVFLTDGAFCERAHIDKFIESLGWRERLSTSKSKTACLPSTLHRISLITKGEGIDASVIGVNVRVGRSTLGVTMQMCPWLTSPKSLRVAPGQPSMSLKGRSILFVGRPGAGKTTLLREMAQALSRVSSNIATESTVVVVDKINEIAGDFEVPHACIGEARWMPCGSPELHAKVMQEAVEYAAPDVVLVDEICNAAEVEAACQIVDRGVTLIATVHGNTLVDILNCPVRQVLLGGLQAKSPGGLELMSLQQDGRHTKANSMRRSTPAFDVIIELHQKDRWILHPDARYAVDNHLRGEPIEAVELRPGLAIATLGIPVDGGLNYCYDCTPGRRCSLHQDLSRAASPRGAPSPRGALGRLACGANLLEETMPPLAQSSSILWESPSPRSEHSPALGRTLSPRSESYRSGASPRRSASPAARGREASPAQRETYSARASRERSGHKTNAEREQSNRTASPANRAASPECERYPLTDRGKSPEDDRRYSSMNGNYKELAVARKRPSEFRSSVFR